MQIWLVQLAPTPTNLSLKVSMPTFLQNQSLSFEDEGKGGSRLVWATLALCSLVVMSLVCVGGLLANVLSIFIYTHRSNRRASINILLTALSAADALLLLLALPAFAFGPFTYVFRGAVFDFMYKCIMLIFYPINRIVRLISVWILVAVTAERYVAVCWPFKARVISTRRRAITLVSAVVSSALAFDLVYFWDYESDPEYLIRPLLRANSRYLFWYANVATVVVEFVLPTIIMSFGTYRIVVGLRRARNEREEMRSTVSQQEATAKMVVAVVLVFIACSTLSHVLNVVEICFPAFFVSWVGYMATDLNNLLVSLNSATSALFYYYFSKRYRTHARRIWNSFKNPRPARPSTRRLQQRRNGIDIEMNSLPNHLRRIRH